jgi:hypothetical protein
VAHDIVQIKRESLKLVFVLAHIQFQAVFLGFVKDGEVKREQSLGIINGNVEPGFRTSWNVVISVPSGSFLRTWIIFEIISF